MVPTRQVLIGSVPPACTIDTLGHATFRGLITVRAIPQTGSFVLNLLPRDPISGACYCSPGGSDLIVTTTAMALYQATLPEVCIVRLAIGRNIILDVNLSPHEENGR